MTSSPRRPRRGPVSRLWAVVVIALVLGLSLIPPSSPPSSASGPVTSSPIGDAAGPTDATWSIPPQTRAPSSTAADPSTIRVASIPALLNALANDRYTTIVVVDGTYQVRPSNESASTSLWIGDRFAARKQPVTVLAETIGGVTFAGDGGRSYGGLSFEDGAHDQTWDGFRFAEMVADRSGIIEIGGYTARRAPSRITLRNITIDRTCRGSARTRSSSALDHAIYIAQALDPGPHDLLFEDIAVDGRGGLASAFQFFHSEPGAPNASKVVIRRLHVRGTQQAIILWDPTLRNVRFEDVDISGALLYAVRYETVGSKGIVLSHVTSTGSGTQGFYSTEGNAPDGVTVVDSTFE